MGTQLAAKPNSSAFRMKASLTKATRVVQTQVPDDELNERLEKDRLAVPLRLNQRVVHTGLLSVVQ